MSSTPRYHLTAKDFSILEVILQRSINNDDTFLRLLRRKLSTATVLFHDDIDANVATINSLVDFTVDGRLSDSRILAHGGEDAFTGMTLPIITLRGLALLGLTAGDAIVVEQSDGTWEEVRLNRVTFQPEAERRGQSRQKVRDEADVRPGEQSAVISFTTRRPPAKDAIDEPSDPDDDDPGPRAAYPSIPLKRRLRAVSRASHTPPNRGI